MLIFIGMGMALKSGRLIAFGAVVAVAGCGGLPASNPTDIAPEADPVLPLLSDLDVPAETPNVNVTAAPRQEGGLLSRLLGRPQPASAVDAALAEALDDPAQAPPEVVAEAAADVVAAPEPTPRRGLFGIINASAGTSEPIEDAVAGQVPPRTIMAFGEIAPTCGMNRREFGTKIAAASGYTIYDTIPNSTAPRPHYITGFNDGCARQFTAALVLMGDVGTHEVVRYSRTRVDLPYSKTDNAYEQIKTSFCRAGFGEPCGSRLERLAKRTTFVTAYESFGAAPIWAEFLLHEGKVAASALEGK